MKKTILPMVILCQLFFECRKPNVKPEPLSVSPEAKPQYNLSSGMTYYTYGTDIVESDFLDNPDDPADQQFNYVGHALTLGLLEVYNNNPTLMNDLVQFISETRNLQGNLFLFAEQHPEIDPIFNQVFASRFQDFGSSWQDYVNAHYQYDTHYTPFACIANKRNYVLTDYPFVASPFEISEEKFKTFDNDYPLWMKTSSALLFSTLNKGNVQDIPNPIIYIGNAFPGDDNNNMHVSPSEFERDQVGLGGGRYYPEEPPVVPMSCGLSPLPAGHTHEWISHVRYQINERYEGTGKSEYTIFWAYYRAHAPAINDWGPYGGPATNRRWWHKESRKVAKSEIGTTKDWYFDVFGPTLYKEPACFDIERMYSQSVWDYFFFAAFEEDDLTPAKSLGTVKAWGGDIIERKEKMKYANEWYFFTPSSNNRFQFTNYFPTPGSTYYNYTKGKLEMLRHY